MSKYIDYLEQLPNGFLHIAQAYANDNKNPQIEPAHLLRALLHKSINLYHVIEDTLNADYYYLVDWADMRIQQCGRSPYGMKGIELSHEAQNVAKEAINLCEKHGAEPSNFLCLLASLLSPGVGFSYEQLKTMPLQASQVLNALGGGSATIVAGHGASQALSSNAATTTDNGYCVNLMEDTASEPMIGFDEKIRSMVEVLARKDRANLLLVGETGVGKTSLVRELSRRIAAGEMPASLSELHPYELDLIMLSQGVSYKGEIEDRFKQVVESLTMLAHPLLVIENFHRVEDKQSLLSGILPNIKRLIQHNELQLLVTTTVDGYTKDIEKDKELTPYFEKLTLEEPSESLAIDILSNKCRAYIDFHGLPIADDIPAEIVRLAKRYMPERHLPSSALDLLDRAMASVKVSNELAQLAGNSPAAERLECDAVRDVVSQMTGIPMGNIQSEERDKLTHAEEILHRRVVGQNHAIKSILDAIYESRSGLNKKGQPMGSFFFLGPTGTGKTELAKSLAEFLFNDESSILRFDMSEYKEEHSVALLYGAPPGYVGYEEGGLLVNQIRQHPYSVVLFDEIEKAHRSVFDLFLQILDEGKLHDRLGRVGDFSNALIIFTSNIGSDYIFQSFGEGKVPTHDQLLEVMQGQFRPEFLARLTEIVPFSPITSEMIDRIFDIHIKHLLKTLTEQNVSLVIDDTARDYVTRVGFNAHYGARPILGIIRKEIRRPLSKLIISGDIPSGDTVTMRYDAESSSIMWDIDSPEPTGGTDS